MGVATDGLERDVRSPLGAEIGKRAGHGREQATLFAKGAMSGNIQVNPTGFASRGSTGPAGSSRPHGAELPADAVNVNRRVCQ
jgi:hypothetical protein